MSFSKHSPYGRALLVHTAFWWNAAEQVSMKLCFSTKVATTKVAWSCSFLLILNSTIVPWNKNVIFKDLAMCSWSTQIPDCPFHSLRCWVFCTKCPPSSSYLAQSMHIMKTDLVKSLCNRWTSWGSTSCNASAIYGYREEESPSAILVQICGHREEAPCAIYGYHEEESPCAILVQICGHREEAPCEIVVQSKDIMKKNHLMQSVNIMKNPSPVCQSLYLWCRDWCLLQIGVAWIMVMMRFLVSSRVNSQIGPTYSWIVWWEKLSSTLELSLWTFQRNKNCAEMMTLGGGGCKE